MGTVQLQVLGHGYSAMGVKSWAWAWIPEIWDLATGTVRKSDSYHWCLPVTPPPMPCCTNCCTTVTFAQRQYQGINHGWVGNIHLWCKLMRQAKKK